MHIPIAIPRIRLSIFPIPIPIHIHSKPGTPPLQRQIPNLSAQTVAVPVSAHATLRDLSLLLVGHVLEGLVAVCHPRPQPCHLPVALFPGGAPVAVVIAVAAGHLQGFGGELHSMSMSVGMSMIVMMMMVMVVMLVIVVVIMIVLQLIVQALIIREIVPRPRTTGSGAAVHAGDMLVVI